MRPNNVYVCALQWTGGLSRVYIIAGPTVCELGKAEVEPHDKSGKMMDGWDYSHNSSYL